jgi:hypothetical protein
LIDVKVNEILQLFATPQKWQFPQLNSLPRAFKVMAAG